MRYAIMVAAFGMVLGAPVLAPTALMSVAVAQAATLTAAEIALDAELVAAANDPDALAAIISRETAAGNVNGLARGLARASRALAATDVGGAAALVIQAVTVAEGADDNAQTEVGAAASAVATTAQNSGDSTTAANVETAVASSSDADVQITYVNNGGSAGTPVLTTGGDTTGGTPPVGGDGTPPVGDTTPPAPAGGPPVRPPQVVVVIPEIPEPNPVQAGVTPEVISAPGGGAPASP